MTLLDAGTASAVAAATSQQAQCEALIAAWEGGNVHAWRYTSGGTLLQRTVQGPFTINADTPRGVESGALVSWEHVATGTTAYTIYRTAGGAEIFRSSGIVWAGPAKALCGMYDRAVVFAANASLPVDSYSVMTVESDGIITPGSQPSSRVSGGKLFTSWVDSIGRTGVTSFDLSAHTSVRTVLSASNQDNSHNNGSVAFAPDGKVLVAWSKHNSSEGCQTRLSSAPYDVSAFASVVAITDSGRQTSYADIWYLSQTGKYYVQSRVRVAGLNSPRKVWRTSDGATFDSPTTWVSHSTNRPYPKFLSDGVSRVHIVSTTGQPAEIACGLHYAYMQLDGSNVEQFYALDGTSLGTGGLVTSSVPAFVSADGGNKWAYDLAIGPDGELWCIYIFFPAGSEGTDQRLMFIRTTGGRTAWDTPLQIAVIGNQLYASEAYSHAGAVFDATDPTIMWACLRNGNPKHEVFKYTTSDNGATWSQAEQITSDSANDNWQPVSPPGHNGYCPVVWITGTYTSWDAGFSSSVKALIRD